MVPNRHASIDSYRYGFQGQEKDDEIKGEGNSLNYTFRMHDPRVGRFFATDPLEKSYPFYSPYQFSGNRVIDVIELEGLEPGMDALRNYIIMSLTGYYYKLKGVGQKGVKNMVEGSTKTNESINNNPVYSQQTKDLLHTAQKINGSLEIMKVVLDPEVQVINAISPIDDAMTLTTGLIYDDLNVRKASKLERGFAGLETVAFMFDAAVFSKPTQKLINEVAEEGLEQTANEIVEETVSVSVKSLNAVEFEIRGSVQKSVGNKKGVYKFTFTNGEEYIGQAQGAKGFAQRVKTSFKEIVTGTSTKKAKAPGLTLERVEFHEFSPFVDENVNAMETRMIEEAGGLGNSKLINKISPPSTSGKN